MRFTRGKPRLKFGSTMGQKGGNSILGHLLGILEAIVRGGDFPFLLLFILAAILAMPRPSRLFRVLERLRVASRLGEVVCPDGSRFKIDFRGLILVYEIYLLDCYECIDQFRILDGDYVIDVGS